MALQNRAEVETYAQQLSRRTSEALSSGSCYRTWSLVFYLVMFKACTLGIVDEELWECYGDVARYLKELSKGVEKVHHYLLQNMPLSRLEQRRALSLERLGPLIEQLDEDYCRGPNEVKERLLGNHLAFEILHEVRTLLVASGIDTTQFALELKQAASKLDRLKDKVDFWASDLSRAATADDLELLYRLRVYHKLILLCAEMMKIVGNGEGDLCGPYKWFLQSVDWENDLLLPELDEEDRPCI